MNSFVLVARFLRIAAEDDRLLSVHVALYVSICSLRPSKNPGTGFRVSRRELMRLAKIRSIVTYHRRLKQLVEFGFIAYEPSYDPYRASRITLC